MAENSEDSPSEPAMVRWTKAVGVFTGLLFLATAFSDFVIWRELRSNERAQAFSEERERAFFSIGAVSQFQGAVDKAGLPTLGIIAQWQNLGGTRAKWAAGWASIQYFPNGAPYNFDATKPAASVAEPVHTAVGPNAFLQAGPIGISHEDSVRSAAGKGEVLVWGAMQYADIYDPQNVHTGHFCAKLVPSGTSTDKSTKEVTEMYKSQPYRNECNTSE